MAVDVSGIRVTVEGAAQANRDLTQLERNLDRTGKAGTKTEGTFARLSRELTSFRGILASLGAGFAVQNLLQTADAFQVLQRRIQTATRETGDFLTVNEELRRIANATGSALSDNVGVFQSLARSATELGATNSDILKLTETVQQLGVIGGATTQGMSAGLLQFSQGLAAGVFRAEEFNSILENLPEVANRIARGMDLTVGELRALVLEGKVASEDVFEALLKQSEEINKQFGEMPLSLAQSMQTLNNEFSRALGALDSQIGVTSGLAAVVRTLANNMDILVNVATLAGIALGGRLAAALASATAGMGAASTAATVLRGALALLGGPAGIAITAGGAFAFLVTRQTEAAQAADLARTATDELNRILGNSEPMTKAAARAALDLAEANLKQAESALTAAKAEQEKFIQQAGGPAAASRMLGTGAISTSGQQRRIENLRSETETLRDTLGKARNELEIVINGPPAGNATSTILKDIGSSASKSAKQVKSFADQFSDLRGDLDPLIPAAEKYNTSVEMLNRAMKEGRITMEEGNRLLGIAKDRFLESADASDNLTESLDKSTKSAVTLTKTADPFFEAWNRSIEDVSRAISDGLVGGFKDAASTIKSIFSSLLSSLVNLSIRNKILIPMGLAPGPAMAGGFGGGGFNPGSLFGLSNGPTTAGASSISPMAAGGLPGGGASSLPFSGNLGFLNNSSFVSNPFASGIGGFAGNLGANALLGSDRGMGANIGGTLGAIGGSFLPLPPGINTAIGSFIGNAIGGLFGGDKKSRVALASNTSPAGFEDQVSAQSAFGTIGFSRGRTKGISDANEFKPLFDSIASLDNVLASSLIPEQINKIKDSLEGFISNKLTSSDAFRPEQLEQLIRERLDVIFGAMDENIARLGNAFRGLPIEQMVAGFTSLNKVAQFLKADPFKDFNTAMVEGSRTLYQQALVSRRELIDMARSFDGSLDAANELANATQNRYQIELALLQQIDTVARGISSSFADTRETIIQATLSQEQLYDRLSTRAEDLARQMQTAIDPQVIGELAAQINQLTGRAFGLLGEEQKQSSSAGFLDFLSGVENLAGQRLDMSRQSIAVDRDAGLSGTVASELSKVISGFGAQQQRLLSEQERAAIAQREAAESSRRAAEAQERAALARETYYSGMGGR